MLHKILIKVYLGYCCLCCMSSVAKTQQVGLVHPDVPQEVLDIALAKYSKKRDLHLGNHTGGNPFNTFNKHDSFNIANF